MEYFDRVSCVVSCLYVNNYCIKYSSLLLGTHLNDETHNLKYLLYVLIEIRHMLFRRFLRFIW